MTHRSLSVTRIGKRFSGADRPAVDVLSFTVGAGEFHTLLGPNGAGRTTTLRMIAGLRTPDFGTSEIEGADLQRARATPSASSPTCPTSRSCTTS